jgi:hypothetical protein
MDIKNIKIIVIGYCVCAIVICLTNLFNLDDKIEYWWRFRNKNRIKPTC